MLGSMRLKRNEWLVILLLIVLAVGIRLFYLNKLGFEFDWDQENDAMAVMNMVWNHKPALIGPRVASDKGFFTGPYHYYFSLPFFLVTGGHPMSGVGLGVLVVALTTAAYYLVGKKLWNPWTGFVAAFLYALSGKLETWNAMYAPLLAVVAFYLIVMAMQGKIKWIWTAILAGIAANLHLVPASISLCLLIGIGLAKKKPTRNELFQMAFFYLIWFFPLIVFDLRHESIISNKVVELISGNSPFVWDRANFFRVLSRAWIVLNTASQSGWRTTIDLLLGINCLLFGWIWIGGDKRFKIFTTLWLLTPIVVLYKYKGNLPEYYFGIATALLPLIFASLVSKTKLLTVLVLLFLVINLPFKRMDPPKILLKNKLALVDYLANQKEDKYFNVSYSLPLGFNNGYEYLFLWRKVSIDRTSRGHLYEIFKLPPLDDGKVVATSGSLGLIRR
jgi:hypothetical protein